MTGDWELSVDAKVSGSLFLLLNLDMAGEGEGSYRNCSFLSVSVHASARCWSIEKHDKGVVRQVGTVMDRTLLSSKFYHIQLRCRGNCISLCVDNHYFFDQVRVGSRELICVLCRSCM